ncbi:MAG: tripartite tricarboxylate transporter substrate binding protein, partial [Synergistaceae bacterium]|nr:tripartite tricarboxylate transporter substrate binding protein [Synergistaceae bacterium]
MKKFSVRVFCAVLALMSLFAGVLVAADWPTKPITLVCGYSAGGSSDLGCRYLAAALEKQLGVPVVVENRPGSGSWVAWNRFLHNTPADGYTFCLVNLSAIFGHYDDANPRKETIDDFELLANQAIDYQVIAIRPDETRFTDYASLLEYAKTNELLTTAASTGMTSGEASVAKMLEKVHGAKIAVVPVGGSSDSNTMFISGNVDFLIANVGDVTLNPENYKVIVVYANNRVSQLPDVPTEKELGLGDYTSFSARGYAYMKGVDPEIVAKMTEALKAAITDEECVANMNKMGVNVELYAGQEYKDLLESQLDQRCEIW